MIIGFHGRLGSGKDTAGKRLAQIVNLPSYQISFAFKLKESASMLFDLMPGWLDANKNNPDAQVVVIDGWVESGEAFDKDGDPVSEPNVIRTFTIREILQRYGTEAHRDVFWSDFWVDQAFRSYDGQLFRDEELIYVTDVRFDNEVNGIHKRGGVVVNIRGKNDPDMYWDPVAESWREEASQLLVHPSEWPLEGIDIEIDNTNLNDEFASLDAQLYALAEKLELPLKEV